jgi:hypothetical protein
MSGHHSAAVAIWHKERLAGVTIDDCKSARYMLDGRSMWAAVNLNDCADGIIILGQRQIVHAISPREESVRQHVADRRHDLE